MNKKIHIAFATTTPGVANKMLCSIIKHLPSYDISIGVLLIGKKDAGVSDAFKISAKIIGEFHEYLPIVNSRNICQTYLQERINVEGGIGFILDDDLRWIMKESKFTELINQLELVRCDMAFSMLKGDPPIPKEYTRASPLLDVLFAIKNNANATSEIRRFIEHVHVVNQVVNFEYHDLYAFDKKCFSPSCLELSGVDWSRFVNKLVKGKSTTRKVITPSGIISATGRERGGATIIMNSEVLNYKNISFHCGSWVSRRSDMMMASAVCNAGYNLYSIPSLMRHEREESFDSHNVDKLIGDILGVSLVESIYDNKKIADCFKYLLTDRLNKTCYILKQTSEMLLLLSAFLNKERLSNKLINNKIDNMVRENQRVIYKFNHLDVDEIVRAYFKFKNELYECDYFCKIK